MSTAVCPHCSSPVPPKVEACLQCGTLQTGGPPPQEETAPARPGFPVTEADIAIGVILLRLLLLLLFVQPKPKNDLDADLWKCFQLGYALLEGLSVVGLFRRTMFGWGLAVAVSGFLTLAAGTGAGSQSPPSFPNPARRAGELSVFAVLAGPMILLLISAGRGTYRVRRKGEPTPVSPAPLRRGSSCTRCGNPCSPYDHPWTRAGFCSRRCLEKGG